MGEKLIAKKRKILSVTGIRSDYALMASLYKAIDKHPKLKLCLIATGAHLAKRFGYTIREIEADGFFIADRIKSLIDSDFKTARIKGAALQLSRLVESINKIKPEILLVLGDREEAIMTALVGTYLNIPIFHISGGDQSYGNNDDVVRHAITKLAHIHFTTNLKSKSNVLKLGEQSFRVKNVGNPGLDRLLNVPKMSRKELSKKLGFDLTKGPIVFALQHPLSTEIDKSYEHMKITLEAVKDLGYATIMVYPNSDAGARQIIRAIEDYRSQIPNMKIFKNIPRLEFVNLMRTADCMIGNSSAGIVETPLLHLPVVNIGRRQQGRLAAENVTFVDHDKKQIIKAITRACFDKKYRKIVDHCSNPYGDGKSSARIVKILANQRIDEKLMIKKLEFPL